jgi:2-keto-3-deoxy-L-rhamnonate aldolase RhmA
MTSILRPWSNEPGLVTRFLDCGVGGIQFPHIEEAHAPHEVVESFSICLGILTHGASGCRTGIVRGRCFPW